jgi:hypothetical protein
MTKRLNCTVGAISRRLKKRAAELMQEEVLTFRHAGGWVLMGGC